MVNIDIEEIKRKNEVIDNAIHIPLHCSIQYMEIMKA